MHFTELEVISLIPAVSVSYKKVIQLPEVPGTHKEKFDYKVVPLIS